MKIFLLGFITVACSISQARSVCLRQAVRAAREQTFHASRVVSAQQISVSPPYLVTYQVELMSPTGEAVSEVEVTLMKSDCSTVFVTPIFQ